MVRATLPLAAQTASTLFADGGTLGGSPGQGIYWSVGTGPQTLVRREDHSGRRRHSDEAEWAALVSALEYAEMFAEPGEPYRIVMDCRPVLKAVESAKRPRTDRLWEPFYRVMFLLESLRHRAIDIDLVWRPRSTVKAHLGH